MPAESTKLEVNKLKYIGTSAAYGQNYPVNVGSTSVVRPVSYQVQDPPRFETKIMGNRAINTVNVVSEPVIQRQIITEQIR